MGWSFFWNSTNYTCDSDISHDGCNICPYNLSQHLLHLDIQIFVLLKSKLSLIRHSLDSFSWSQCQILMEDISRRKFHSSTNHPILFILFGFYIFKKNSQAKSFLVVYIQHVHTKQWCISWRFIPYYCYKNMYNYTYKHIHVSLNICITAGYLYLLGYCSPETI